MNDLYVMAVYDIRGKFLGLRAILKEYVASMVMSFEDSSRGELEEITLDIIDSEISSKHIFRRTFKGYSVVVSNFKELEKRALGK